MMEQEAPDLPFLHEHRNSTTPRKISLVRNPETNWNAPAPQTDAKPAWPNPLERFGTPSCWNPYSWHSTPDTPSSHLPRKEGIGFVSRPPTFLRVLPRGLASILPVFEFWWDQHSLSANGIMETVTWAGRHHISCPLLITGQLDKTYSCLFLSGEGNVGRGL